MLRMYVGEKQHSRDKEFFIIEFAYNDHLHSIIGVSPFYILYGQECEAPTPSNRFESIMI